ncbi:hypothetical protein C1I98_02250 [Spongiactinospora gelatinilytica]|uniref:Uncharacterized protein n=1 Tax=Spongiactinospora gelatinilytica TaxID=2666298 RepID=A0A2W2J337_9ACTN|nr:hypothetical protein [Spongiactinospora gelatinilytica]PZG56014.1 hypothetical protein C1I98_02250 [Spongiactinospora gelatinilytica]
MQATTRELGSAIGVAVIGTLLTSRFVHHRSVSADVGGRVPYTVGEALATAPPSRYDAIVSAYTSSAAATLKIAAAIVLIAGLLVLAEMTWATRRAARSTRAASGTRPSTAVRHRAEALVAALGKRRRPAGSTSAAR